MNKNATLILAGGLGTRLRPVDGGLPKPMVEVLGRPFLYWLIQHLSQFGYKDFSLSVGYKGEYISGYEWDKAFPQCHFEFIQEKTPLGTGGAVKNYFDLKPQVRAAWIINGDTLLEKPPLFGIGLSPGEVVYSALASQNVFDALPNLVVDGNLVTGVDEKKASVFDGGHVLISREAVDKYKGDMPCSFHQLLAQSFKERKVKFSLIDGSCYDIGTPQRLQRFENYIRGKKSV